MAIKTYRPITPTLRFQTSLVNDDITTNRPYKPLLVIKQRTGGRRNSGDITIRHHGGRPQEEAPPDRLQARQVRRAGQGRVDRIRPNRSSRIALVNYADGEKRYILQPVGLQVGQTSHERTRGRYSDRQRAAAQEHSGRHHGAQCRASSGQGSPDGALRRDRRRNWWPKKATTHS